MAEAEFIELIRVILNEKSGDVAVGKVQQLLKKRPELAKMQRKEDYNRLPLHDAATVDGIDVRIVELLLKAYPQATMQKDSNGDAPLRIAVQLQGGLGGAAVCQLLLQYGPQAAMEKDKGGFLPLHVAAQFQGGAKGTAIVELLLKAAPQACMEKENLGWLPLHVAAQFQGGAKGTAIVELLLKAAPQACMEKENLAWLPLHVAAQFQGGAKGAAIVELLLKAAPQACMEKTKVGDTPLHLAATHQGGDKGTAVVEALLRAAPQAISIKANDGKTPLDWALERVKREVANTTQLSASDPLIALLNAAATNAPSPLKPPASTPTSSPPKPAPIAPSVPIILYDIFISLRFGEAMDEAVALKAALQQRGLSIFLCDVPPGVDIADTVISALAHCKLAVILGTLTYGTKTTAGFSTFDELRYIKNEAKPFFLVKMCDRFQVEEAKVRLPIDISYFPWQPKREAEKKRVPSALVEQILQRHAAVVAGGSSGAASGSASPTKLAGAHHPTPAAAAFSGSVDELEPEFISWLAALKLGSDLPKLQQAFHSWGILSKDKLSLGVRKNRVTVERLVGEGIREMSAEAVIDVVERS